MNTRIDTLRKQLAHIAQADYDSAHGLPATFYTDADWDKHEREHLFARSWLCAGRVEQFSAPGDYLALSLAGEPVLVVRDETGKLRALSNVCRHRGTVLVDGTGNSRRFTCPYHHWVYDSQGSLLAAPGIPARADFDPANCRLPEFACVEWLGFVLVNLDPLAKAPHTNLESLLPLIGNYHLEAMTLGYSAEAVWPVNWKSLLENYMEGYHLTPLHRDTLHKVNPSRLCRHVPAGDDWFAYQVGFSTRVDDEQLGDPDLSDDERNTCVMVAIPPGFAIGIGSDYSSYLCLEPRDADNVHVRTGLIFHGKEWDEASVTQAVKLFDETMDEDKAVLMRVRDGLHSARFQPGPLAPAPLEGTLLDFYRWMSRNLP